MSEPLIIQTEVKENGKKTKIFKRKENSYVGRFHCKQKNLFLSELKLNNPLHQNERRFVASIRLDGQGEHEGKVQLTQMSLNADELRQLKQEIEDLLGEH